MKQIEDNLLFFSKYKIVYLPLLDICLESGEIAGYKYSICFFKAAHRFGGAEGNISLGSWFGWKTGTQALFSGGSSCGTDAETELRVQFRCSAETKIVEMRHDEDCIYEAVVNAPGGCGKNAKETVERAIPVEILDTINS